MIPKAETNIVAHIFATAQNDKGVQEILDIFTTAKIEVKPTPARKKK